MASWRRWAVTPGRLESSAVSLTLAILKLPWQRVVNKQGGLAAGYPGGRSGHRQVLEAEGYKVTDDLTVDVLNLIWWPPKQAEPKEEDDY